MVVADEPLVGEAFTCDERNICRKIEDRGTRTEEMGEGETVAGNS